MEVCEEMFWSKPSVLYNYDSFYPSSKCKSNKVNSITRIIILFLIVELTLYAWFKNTQGIVLVPALIAGVLMIPVFVRMSQLSGYSVHENFETIQQQGSLIGDKSDNDDIKGMTAIPSGSAIIKEMTIGQLPETANKPWTEPTPNNPFMNLLVTDYKDSPNKPAAISNSNPVIKQSLDDYFRTQWFSDPTDVFGKTQSQRQFITMPSTSIPNDRESYQNWLYKIPGKTCKEGGRAACLAGTDGSSVTWLNQN
jgi:hypothetical protein